MCPLRDLISNQLSISDTSARAQIGLKIQDFGLGVLGSALKP